jgi:hypothetical protein
MYDGECNGAKCASGGRTAAAAQRRCMARGSCVRACGVYSAAGAGSGVSGLQETQMPVRACTDALYIGG